MKIIKEYRQKLNLRQEDLARLLKVDRSTVAKWENGESTPRTNMLPKIAEILSCKIADLFFYPEK